MKRSALAAACLCLCAPSVAGAYCRTTNCNPTSNDPEQRCRLDANGCDTVGLPLQWPSSCVSYSVHKAGSPSRDISFDEAVEIAQRSFAAWENADCGAGEVPSIVIEDRSPSGCGTATYNTNAANANVVLFQDEAWPYMGADTTLALTTITFNVETGDIYDADIEINSARTPLTIGNASVNFDLQSILTHEVGHFFGLAHSEVRGATMQPRYESPDTSLRDLESDDIAGICSIYPADRVPSRQSCEPRHGFTRDCKPREDKGCSIAQVGPPVEGPRSARLFALILAPLLLSRLARRRRRA